MKNLETRITKSQEKRLKNGTLTGSHIIVNQNGKCLLNKTYGKASVNGEPLQSDATYRIASMTKPITAVALLIEHEKGRLNIFDDVSEYLDGFDEMTIALSDGTVVNAKNKIKLYMLVSHISGINSAAIEGTNSTMPLETRDLDMVAEYTSKVPLCFEPGTSQEYNTIGYDIAAKIIEKTSGMNFAEYLKVNIFDKLGMKDTTFMPSSDQWNRMVTIHGMQNKKAVDLPSEKNSVIDGYPVTYFAAGCALISTADDYSIFAEMLLNDGYPIMNRESLRLMTTPVVGDDIMPYSQKWGLGVRVITDDKYVLPKGSFGWSGKYGSHFWIDPKNKITAVYMKNSAFDGGAGCNTANEFEKDVMKSI